MLPVIILVVIQPIYWLSFPFVYVFVAKRYKRHTYAMLTIVLMIFIPYHRDILSNIYFYYLSKSPITEIYETVEKPISILWEDTRTNKFYYDYGTRDNKNKHLEKEHRSIIRRYLDGNNVKLLIYKGLDEKYYVFRADEKDYEEAVKLALEVKKSQGNLRT